MVFIILGGKDSKKKQNWHALFCFHLVYSRDLLLLVDTGDVHSEVEQDGVVIIPFGRITCYTVLERKT